jgi:hypothetical protein
MRLVPVLFRGVVIILAVLLGVSYLWSGWLDWLPPAWEPVAYGLLAVAIVLDLASYRSERLARFLFGKPKR